MITDVRANPEKFSSEHLEQAIMLASEKLTAKRIAFIDCYIRNGFCGSAALIEAKYKAKSPQVASAAAARLLASVSIQNYLRWRLVQLTQQKDIEIDEGLLIRESNALAYAAITDVLDWDANGKVTVKPSADLPRETVAAIKKIRSVTRSIPQEDGPPIEETKIEVEMHDKRGALDLQARIAGMLREAKQSDFSNYTLNCYFGGPPEEKDISPPVAG